MEQDNEQTTYGKYTVVSADDKSTVIDYTIEKVVAKGEIPGLGDAMEKMSGITMTFTLDTKRDIKKVDGMDKFLDKIGGDDPDTKKMLAAMMSEDTFKQGMSELLLVGSDSVSKVGDTWKQEYKYPLGPLGAMKVNSDYKFAETTDAGNKVTWTAKSEYTLPTEDGGLPFTFSKGDLKTEEFKGEMVFDPKAGRLVSSTTNMKTNGKLTISAGGMEIDLTIKQTITAKTTVSDKSLNDE